MTASTTTSPREIVTMPYARWEDAMLAQHRIVDWYSTTRGQRYLHGFFESLNNGHQPEHQRRVEALAGIQRHMVSQAEPIYVGDDVCEVIDHARQSFEPEPVLPSDPFTPNGFLLLPRPIFLKDAPITEESPGRSPTGEIPVRAIAWSTMTSENSEVGCFWIAYFVDIRDEEAAGRHRFDGDDQVVTDYMRAYAPLSMVHQFQWSWGENPWVDPKKLEVLAEDSLEEAMQRARQQVQLIQAVWRIASQIVPTRERPIRQMRRDAKRKGLPHDEVTVITLRRGHEAHDDDDHDSGRRLTVQHLVRGYWARRHTRDGVRQVWVRPHLRGDDSLPFKATTRAWELTR